METEVGSGDANDEGIACCFWDLIGSAPFIDFSGLRGSGATTSDLFEVPLSFSVASVHSAVYLSFPIIPIIVKFFLRYRWYSALACA
jgi:hypothetical protein